MYYFAYGANLDTNYLAKYIETENIHIVGSAYIDNTLFRKIEHVSIIMYMQEAHSGHRFQNNYDKSFASPL